MKLFCKEAMLVIIGLLSCLVAAGCRSTPEEISATSPSRSLINPFALDVKNYEDGCSAKLVNTTEEAFLVASRVQFVVSGKIGDKVINERTGFTGNDFRRLIVVKPASSFRRNYVSIPLPADLSSIADLRVHVLYLPFSSLRRVSNESWADDFMEQVIATTPTQSINREAGR